MAKIANLPGADGSIGVLSDLLVGLLGAGAGGAC